MAVIAKRYRKHFFVPLFKAHVMMLGTAAAGDNADGHVK